MRWLIKISREGEKNLLPQINQPDFESSISGRAEYLLIKI